MIVKSNCYFYYGEIIVLCGCFSTLNALCNSVILPPSAVFMEYII